MTDFSGLRESMVVNQVAARGVRSENVLNAMREVPRELFVPNRLAEFAYEDSPLSIAAGQTISQPYIVAFMIEALGLRGGEKVLEIGAGSGYAAAVLARSPAKSTRSNTLRNLPKVPHPSSQNSATITCRCCTAMERLVGRNTPLTMASSSPPVGQKSPNR